MIYSFISGNFNLCFLYVLSVRQLEQWLIGFPRLPAPQTTVELQHSLERQRVHCSLFRSYPSHHPHTTWSYSFFPYLPMEKCKKKRVCFKRNRKLMYIRAPAVPHGRRRGLVNTGIGFHALEPNLPAALPWQDLMRAKCIHNIPITLETPTKMRK